MGTNWAFFFTAVSAFFTWRILLYSDMWDFVEHHVMHGDAWHFYSKFVPKPLIQIV